MRNWLQKVLFCAVLSCSLFCTGGCGRTYDVEVVVISPHSPEVRKEFDIGFPDWYKKKTGKTAVIKWLDIGGTGDCIKYILSRNKEGKDIGVDVFFGGGTYPFIKLSKEKLLEPYKLPAHISSKIPQEIHGVPMYSSEGLWYGAALSGFGIVYNKKIIEDQNLLEPKTWAELADRKSFGWVASGDPRYSGSIHAMYEILLQAYGWEKGWEFIIRMGANVQTFTEGGSSAAKDVSKGQAAYGLCIDYYAFAEIERYGSDRLGFMLPEGETVINPDAIGIIKNGPNTDAAKEFLEYVLTDGQKLWVLKKGIPEGPVEKSLCRLPVDATLYSYDKKDMSVSINPFTLESSLQYSDSKAGRRWPILGDLVASFVIIPHEDLKKCWKNMRQKGIKPEDFSRYFKIDLTEKEAFDLARKWDTKEFAAERIKYMNTWAANARKRYTSIYK